MKQQPRHTKKKVRDDNPSSQTRERGISPDRRASADNDTHGHATGDKVLKRFARILFSNLLNGDIAARMGGDEVVLILTNTHAEQAETVAQGIQQQVAECAATHQLKFGVTIGIGEAPTRGLTLDDLPAKVDRALYHAKAEYGGGSIMRTSNLEANLTTKALVI